MQSSINLSGTYQGEPSTRPLTVLHLDNRLCIFKGNPWNIGGSWFNFTFYCFPKCCLWTEARAEAIGACWNAWITFSKKMGLSFFFFILFFGGEGVLRAWDSPFVTPLSHVCEKKLKQRIFLTIVKIVKKVASMFFEPVRSASSLIVRKFVKNGQIPGSMFGCLV